MAAFLRAGALALSALLAALAFAAIHHPAAAQGGYAVGIQSSPRVGVEPLAITFRLTLFTERGGRFTSGFIDFGDGSARVDVYRRGSLRTHVAHTYRRPGTFNVNLVMTTADGEAMSKTARVRVRPSKEADPGELLKVEPTTGDAPLEAKIAIGGASLPFVARSLLLDLGDGTRREVLPLSEVSHVYEKPGRYDVRLLVRGRDENSARASTTVTVFREPRLILQVAPPAGVAPMQVTVRAAIPQGRIGQAEVLLDGQTFATRPGVHTHLFEKAGTYTFRLAAVTQSGQELSREVTVRVFEEPIAGLYEHDGGVVEIVGGGGAFEGVMRAPSGAQAQAGYDIGKTFVRGAYADVARIIPTGVSEDRPRSVMDRFAQQLAEGQYLVLNGQGCPEQWADYRFRIDFGQRSNQDAEVWQRAQSISGPVNYRTYMTRFERIYRRRGEPVPQPGLAGHVDWVGYMIAAMRGAGETGNPEDCVTEDNATAARQALFRRISADEAVRLAETNIAAVQEFARHAMEAPPDPRADGTPRGVDPAQGLPPASADPVLLHSGELIEAAVDVMLPGRGMDWTFSRTYRSQSRELSGLGHGWTHSDMHALERLDDGYRFRAAGGGWARLSPAGDNLFSGPAGERLLVEPETLTVRQRDGTLYRFSPAPGDPDHTQIASVEDAAGNRITYLHDLLGRVSSVTDTLGREIRYEYGPAGLLARILLPDGRSIGFEQDGAGRLVRVSHFEAEAETAYRSYRYGYSAVDAQDIDLKHNLVAIWRAGDVSSTPAVEMRYGEDLAAHEFDRVVWQRTGRSEETFSYARSETAAGPRFETRVEAAERASELYLFRPDGQLETTSYTAADGRMIASRRDYDSEGRLVRTVLPLGAAVEMIARDGEGDREELRLVPPPGSPTEAVAYLIEREPLFGLTRAIYGPFPDRVPPDEAAIARAVISETRFDYEEAAELPPKLARFGLGPVGLGLGDLNDDGNTDGASGRPILVLAPAEADPTGAERPLLETRIVYRADGLPAETWRPDGAVLAYQYQNARDGRPAFLSRIVERRGGIERQLAGYEWDEEGRLIGLAGPEGIILGIANDAFGRPVLIIPADPAKRGRRLTYDAADRVIEERLFTAADRHTGAAGHDFARYSYDAAGALEILALLPSAGADWIERRYGYDPYGRLVSIAAGDTLWTRRFDPFGRVVGEGYAESAWREFAYDDDGRLVSETGPYGEAARYSYDGLGRIVGTEGAGLRLSRRLDLSGRVLERRAIDAVTGNGRADLFTYSPSGRLLEAAAGQVSGDELTGLRTLYRIAYDRFGRPQAVERFDEAGADVLPIRLDDDGRIAAIGPPGGELVQLGRDRSGRVTYATGPGNPPVGIERDVLGRAVDVGVPGGMRLVRSPPDDDGPAVLHRFGSETSEVQRSAAWRDRLGRPIRAMREVVAGPAATVLQDWEIRWDAYSRLEAVIDRGLPIAELSYDPVGRITRRSYFGLGETRFEYGISPSAGSDGFIAELARLDARGSRVEIDRQGTNLAIQASQPEAGAVTSKVERDGFGAIVRHHRNGWKWERRQERTDAQTDVLTAPDGTVWSVERHYTDRGKLSGVRLPSGLETRFSRARWDSAELSAGRLDIELGYDRSGALVSVSAGDVVLETGRQWATPGEELRSVAISVANKPLLGWRWRFRDGRLSEVEVSPAGTSLHFARDSHGRLISGQALRRSDSDDPTVRSFSYEYDARGNRLATGAGPESVTYVAREPYGYAEIGGAAAVYDPDGRLVRLGDESFAYDALGDLVGYRDEARGLQIDYSRDALRRVVARRTGSEATVLVHDETGLLGVYSSAGAAREWLRDDRGNLVAMAVAGELLLSASAPDGSLLALIDANGKVRELYDYAPFGAPALTDGDGEEQPLPIAALFQGMVYDPDSRLYLTRRRPYRADLGTFLAPEPLGPFVASHPYAYALDDPASYRELDGAQAEPVSGTADMENASRLERAGAAAWDPLTGGLNDVGDQIGNGSEAGQGTSGGSGAGADQSGTGPDTGAVALPSEEELPPPPASTRDPEQEAREQWEREYRRRESDRRDAERQAALARFKASVEHARSVLPNEVARQWLPTDTRFGFGRFAEVEAADMLGTGPRGPAPIGASRDPHALIREVLRTPLPEHDPAGAERIRSVYHGIMNEPETGLAVAAPTPSGETRYAPDAVAVPTPEPTPGAPGAAEHVLRPDGVEIGIDDGRVQPAPPAPSRPPGGLSGLIGG